MQLQQGDLVLLRGTNDHGIVIRVASKNLFEADKEDRAELEQWLISFIF